MVAWTHSFTAFHGPVPPSLCPACHLQLPAKWGGYFDELGHFCHGDLELHMSILGSCSRYSVHKTPLLATLSITTALPKEHYYLFLLSACLGTTLSTSKGSPKRTMYTWSASAMLFSHMYTCPVLKLSMKP